MRGLLTKWTGGGREAPEPLEGNVVATVVTGTVVWALLFLGQLPFFGWYADHGHEWWIWTCAAGAGLGTAGIWYVRHREATLRAARQEDAPGPGPGSGSDG